MTDTPGPKPRFVVRGWHVLAGIVGFFTVVGAVDGVFVALALRTFPGEVSPTPYEDGIAYNRKLAQVAAQAVLGWQATADVGADGNVVVRVHDRAGLAVSGLDAVGRLERPATAAGRRTLAFIERAPGEYSAGPGQLTGSWDLTVEFAGPAGRRFAAERRLTWP